MSHNYPVRAVLIPVLAAFFATQAAWNGRNLKLRDLPDKSWLKVCEYKGAVSTAATGGMQEVPWAYDQNSKVFVRVGGCTGGYTNAICFFDMGTETTTFPWPQQISPVPTDRPGVGCNRGVCYDPVTKNIVEVAGGGATDIGVYGYWRGDMSARTWTQFKTCPPQNQGQVAADTANKVWVATYFDRSHILHCTVYDPKTDSLIHVPARPGSSVITGVYFPIDWWQTLEYAPGLNGTVYFGYMYKDTAWGYYSSQWITWLFDAKTRTWTDLKPTGLEGLPANYVSQGFRPVLSWDPIANVLLVLINGIGLFSYNQSVNRWEKIEPAVTPTGWGQMFEYDTEHNVHAFVGMLNSWTADVWAFRYANSPASETEEPALRTVAVSSLDCAPNPFTAGTRIQYRIRTASRVRLSILDVRGRIMATLVDESKKPGAYSAAWGDAKAAPGLYILKLESNGAAECGTVLLAR